MGEPCKVFVGNLPYDCNSDDLCDHFSSYGKIEDAVVITDRETGRSRGFGFVTFSEENEAESAISQGHESDLKGRNLTVRKAESKRGGGGGGGGGNYRSGYGGGGYGGGGRQGGGYGGRQRGYGGGRDDGGYGGGGRRGYDEDGGYGGSGGYGGGYGGSRFIF